MTVFETARLLVDSRGKRLSRVVRDSSRDSRTATRPAVRAQRQRGRAPGRRVGAIYGGRRLRARRSLGERDVPFPSGSSEASAVCPQHRERRGPDSSGPRTSLALRQVTPKQESRARNERFTRGLIGQTLLRPWPPASAIADGPSPCADHQPATRRANTTRRGYGWPHQRLRNSLRLTVEASVVTCARCGDPIQPGEARGNLATAEKDAGWRYSRVWSAAESGLLTSRAESPTDHFAVEAGAETITAVEFGVVTFLSAPLGRGGPAPKS